MWAAAAKEMRLCENNISANTKVSAEVEGGGAPGVEAEIPLRPMVTQAVPPAAHGWPLAGAQECTHRRLWPHGEPTVSTLLAGPAEREAHAGTGLLAWPVTPVKQSVPERLHPVERTHSRGVCEDCSLWKGLMLEKFMEGLHAEAGEEYRLLPRRRKKQQWKCVMHWTQPPLLIPLHHWGVGERKIRNEV